MRIVDAYTIRPDEIEVGDVMLFVVKAMVVRPGVYRLYRCPYPPTLLYNEEIPQGSRINGDEREVCEALFPTLAQVAKPDESGCFITSSMFGEHEIIFASACRKHSVDDEVHAAYKDLYEITGGTDMPENWQDPNVQAKLMALAAAIRRTATAERIN